MKYPSDLSDTPWEKIEKFFERPDPRGARSKYSKRRVVEAVLYRLRESCRWRAMPHDFPPWDTVFDHWRRWHKRGVWQEAVARGGHPLAGDHPGSRPASASPRDPRWPEREKCRRGRGARFPRWPAHQGPLAPCGRR